MLAMPALRRPGLLLSAVVAITVPGVLAVIALLGPDHAATRATAFAGGGAGEATAGSGELYDYAESAQDGMGIQLLGESAAASLAASYQGVELLAQWGVGGPGHDRLRRVAQRWRDGHPDIGRRDAGAAPSRTSPTTRTTGHLRGSSGSPRPWSRCSASTTSPSTGAPARPSAGPRSIVELYRFDGTLAARFWLDRQTMVPLRREVFDTSAKLISEDAFVQVQFGALDRAPGARGRRGRVKRQRQASARAAAATPSGSGWSAVTAPAQLLAGLNKQGWRLPVTLPGGLPLYSAARSKTAAGRCSTSSTPTGSRRLALRAARHARAAACRLAAGQPARAPGLRLRALGHLGRGAASSTR